MPPDDTKPDHVRQLAEGRILSREALTEALVLEQAARSRAEASDRAKSRLLALVSHELRTPMGAVIAMADLLLTSKLEGNQRRYAETLQSSAKGLLALLNEILDFSKLEAGRFELDTAPFDLKLLIDEVAGDLCLRAREKGLDCQVEIAEDCPEWVAGDQMRLRQILTNLIDNAVKFTAQGAIRFEVSARDNGDSYAVCFNLKDTGLGLSDADRMRLFQPYVQVDPKVSAEFGGTGLGLFIARKLAELMGGTIGCESKLGEGSRFWVEVPMASAQAVKQEDMAGKEDARLNGTVLVVEDNTVNRMLIGAYLDEFGITYKMAESGQEALRLIGERRFDLVLMDIMMPDLDGIETTKRIRALEGRPSEIPIVALTANAMKGDREAYLAAGMNAYLSKPIRGRELYDEIATFLAPEARESQAAKR